MCQIGCDPKNDSTRLLLGHICRETVLDQVRASEPEAIRPEDIVHTGWNGVTCVEAGGPEPGVGCAGRGIIVALQLLDRLKALPDADVTLYDVLGDVVCGGFAMPIREGYATDIYIVSSGELMSLYAANNIAKGIRRFAGPGAPGRAHREQPEYAGRTGTAYGICGAPEYKAHRIHTEEPDRESCGKSPPDSAPVRAGVSAGGGIPSAGGSNLGEYSAVRAHADHF